MTEGEQPKMSWEQTIMIVLSIAALLIMVVFVYIATSVVGRTMS